MQQIRKPSTIQEERKQVKQYYKELFRFYLKPF